MRRLPRLSITATPCRLASTHPAHLDFSSLPARAAYIAANTAARCSNGDVAGVLAAHAAFSAAQKAAEAAAAAHNAASRRGPPAQSHPGSAAASTTSKTELASLRATAERLREVRDSLASSLPCDTHPASPIGPPEAAALVSYLGTMPQFSFPPKDHEELGAALGLFDFEGGRAIAGAGFVCLTGDGVLLEQALVAYALSAARAAGFSLVAPPDLARAGVVVGCGFDPRQPAAPIPAKILPLPPTLPPSPPPPPAGSAICRPLAFMATPPAPGSMKPRR